MSDTQLQTKIKTTLVKLMEANHKFKLAKEAGENWFHNRRLLRFLNGSKTFDQWAKENMFNTYSVDYLLYKSKRDLLQQELDFLHKVAEQPSITDKKKVKIK